MSLRRPDFLDTYTAIEVPTPILSTSEQDAVATEAIEAFFQTIRSSLGLSEVALQDFFEQEKRSMNGADSVVPSEEGLQDSIEVFKRRGGQIIASVLRMSDAPGTLTTRFKRHHLLDETYQAIYDFRSLESSEDT